jgi:hypothetical protein
VPDDQLRKDDRQRHIGALTPLPFSFVGADVKSEQGLLHAPSSSLTHQDVLTAGHDRTRPHAPAMSRRKISIPRAAAGALVAALLSMGGARTRAYINNEVGSSHETGWRGEPLQIWILK